MAERRCPKRARSETPPDNAAGAATTMAAAPDAKTAPAPEDAIPIAMNLFAARGWTGTTLADIADAAGLSFAVLHPAYPSKAAVLRGFMAMVDRAVLATPPDTDATPREALFEIFMRRFDALQPYRAALARLAGDLTRDPAAALCLARRGAASVAAMAERAGIDTGGPLGTIRVKALIALHAWTMRTWLTDDTADMARTMKTLDQGLERLEMLARSMPRRLAARPAT
jgi:AcrR family transcriptional regulator